MNTLARLFHCIHLEILFFGFYHGVSTVVISNLARGLLGNGSLLEVTTRGTLQGTQQALWNTHVGYVTGRNKMRPLLVAARNENAENPQQQRALLPLGLWPHLIDWVNGTRQDEAKVSWIQFILVSRPNEICGNQRRNNNRRRLP